MFLLFCVSVGSFRDELTVLFRSFVCWFSTNSYGFLGRVYFSRLSGMDAGENPPLQQEGRKEQRIRRKEKREKNKKKSKD